MTVAGVKSRCALAIALFGLACSRSPATLGSQIKSGQLKDRPTEDWLISLPPGSTISVCGDYVTEGIQSVTQWAEAAGRSSGLSIVHGCSAGYVLTIHDSDNADAKALCAQYPGAAALGGKTINFCTNVGQDLRHNIMLHEIGHIWGLCDQYSTEGLDSSTANAADNCDPNHSTAKDPNSVMGAAMARRMTMVLRWPVVASKRA